MKKEKGKKDNQKKESSLITKESICLKCAVFSLLFFSISTFTFVGCKTKDNSSSSDIIPNETIDSTLGDSGTTEPEFPTSSIPEASVQPESPAIPYERIEDLITELSLGNYTFDKETEQGKISYLVDGDLVYTKDSTEKFGEYYSYENGKMYRLVYVEEEEKYHKYNENELVSFDNFIYDTLVATNWTAFDEVQDTVSGNLGELDYSLDLSDKTLSGELSGRIYDIDSTIVMKPTYIIDKTVDVPVIEPDDPVIDAPVVQGENIYEIVDGKYVFNVVAIKDVLLNWMQGDNQYGKDLLAQRTYTADAVTDEIVYVNASESKIDFGFVYHNSTNKYFVSTYFDDSSLYTKVQNGTIKTKEQFDGYLNSINQLLNLRNSRDRVEVDANISDENFKILTQRVFDRLENKGVQVGSINNNYPETKLAGFSDAEVLYGFKETSSITSAAFDMGFKKTWSQYYLIKYCGDIELVSIKVSSSVNDTSDELKHVLENNSGKWMVNEITREECDLSNEVLYQIQAVAMAIDYTANEDKKRELI